MSGSLDNTGTIIVGGGIPSGSRYVMPGGVMADSGTLTNEGLLQINGSKGPHPGRYLPAGGSLDVTGVLIDSGTIAIGAIAG